jgi:hypothetical protein
MTTSRASKNKLWWPRPYISWSAFEKWTGSPNEFVKHYCPPQCRSCGEILWRPDWESGKCHTCGQPVISEWTNPPMQIGLRVADMLESDDPQEDEMLEHYRTLLPKYPHREFAINEEFAGIRFAGKLDGWNPGTMTIGEYKTGKDWSQRRADEHRQLDFYQLLIFLLYGKLAERIRLHWMPTRFNFGTMLPELTGAIETFETMSTKADALKMASDAIKAYQEIGERCGSLPMPSGYTGLSPEK